MSDPTFRSPDSREVRDAERPRTNDERAAGTAAGTATGAVAGAVAGVAGGLGTIAAGPLGAIFGALAGAAIGAGAGQGTAETMYTTEHDEHYRALWEATPGRAADASFDTARPAYQLGHVAAAQPEYAGRDFHAVEPDLHGIWDRDFAARYGSWEIARHYVCDGYGHARGEGLGVRRDATVIGTGGSAVDPVELARAQAGLASRADTPEGDEPLFPTDLAATSGTVVEAPQGGRLGERDEIPANRAHPESTDFI